ncbi:MAG: hypothetical protein COU27_02110 [Candidatus Levybacteria bacterium CG10_big_fil_rev_8_21_14_0_10_36_7]|nr:MAG: hypothetical protein COU27_02110 [Candidatus Levybacteria bacterium CG10_big_fil_rev_8_21_14_0_10_36_7]
MKKLRIKNIFSSKKFIISSFLIIFTITIGVTSFLYVSSIQNARQLESQLSQTKKTLDQKKEELEKIKSEDQFVRNEKLQDEIKNIEKTYAQAVQVYEKLLDLKDKGENTNKLDEKFTKSLSLLSERNYSSASAELTSLSEEINTQNNDIAASFSIPSNIQENNSPPAQGYSRQQVSTDIGNYLVDIVSADLGSTKVIVDTASDSTCHDNCPVLALGDYVARNGAFAGINGSYFCPASYPSCAGKTNSFDTLLMNKNKVYFNSDNNVYSTVPAVIFGNGWIRFVGASQEWGRDTGIDSMLANQPLLVSGGRNVFAGDSDPKKGIKAGRSFVANRGNTVYIGVVHNASVAEAGKVLETMGMDNALNLDSGGSTAFWAGGYKVGPGRNIPNAILFVNK